MTPPHFLSTLTARALLCLAAVTGASAQVVINEIHYHPVEEAVFDANGAPVLDLSQDVHEFIELHNAGPAAVSLEGWRLDSAVTFNFPAGTTLAPGGYLVIAADPGRLAQVPQYQIPAGTLLGPYAGRLSNGAGETLRLKDAAGHTVDAVAYSATFPWPTSADAFGASDRWTGLDSLQWQYRGRSLERLNPLWPSSDPANWVASAFPGDPTPGRPNSRTQAEPYPIVLTHRIAQASDGLFPVLQGQESVVQISLSGTNRTGRVRLEYFVDEINRTNEVVASVDMTANPPFYSAHLPGFPGRSVVRYRVLAERQPPQGTAFEQRILPREDDAFPWKGFFAVPSRVATNDVYDLFVSTNSLAQLIRNMADNPANGWHPAPGTKVTGRFNDTEPATLAYKGNLYDVQVRHSGSFYRRDYSRSSFKVEFASYANLEGHSTILILDKGIENVFGHRLFEEFGFPTSHVRPVDLYLNADARVNRLEFEETDEKLMARWADRQKRLHPDQPTPGPGHAWKASGVSIDDGPFGSANGVLLQTNEGWMPVQRYEWVYSSKTLDWEGYVPFKTMMDEMWTARGQTSPGSAPLNVQTLRAYMTSKWDVSAMIDYLAIREWMGVWDDSYHNYFVWKRSDGVWQMLPWDFDGELGETTRSIFNGEEGNFFKDNLFKTYREEYKQRLWWLNNTALHPDYLASIGITHPNMITYGPLRMDEVNRQLGYGPFLKPSRPLAVSPVAGESVAGAVTLTSSPYAYTPSPAAAHLSTYWAIRTAEGTYHDPVYGVTSVVDLTTTTIPAGVLESGKLYYWRCTYHDANGHPSLPSPEAAFHYGGTFERKTLVSLTSAWTYNATGSNLAKLWREKTYDDKAWKQGAGLFGVVTGAVATPAPVQTPLPLGIRTYYFRTRFTIPGSAADVLLRLRHVVDDGAVFYINGAEAYRFNMGTFYGAGLVPYSAASSRDIPVATYEGPIDLPATNLVQGENVLAVEVHQYRTDSPDVLFGAVLEATYEQATGALRLNEVAALNAGSVPHDGLHPDWVEIINPTDSVQPLGDVCLTDDLSVPDKFVFPAGPLLAPGERVVVWCDAVNKPSGHVAPFGLSSQGGGVWLFNRGPGGTFTQLDSLRYGLQLPDTTVARHPDGTGAWALSTPTPSGPNRPQALASPSSLRINEWMASPDTGADWFEVFNPELRPVAIGGFHFTDDLNNRTNSPVPPLSFLAPWSFTRFVADSDPGQGATHVNFKLSGNGEAIGLFDPSGFPVDALQFGPQTTGVSEGRLPDGGIARVTFAIPTPGASNLGDSDGDGMPDAWETAHGLNPAVADGSVDTDGDGMTNLDEFLAGTDPRDASSALQLEWVPGSETNPALRFNAAAGKVYDLEFRESLEEGDWQLFQSTGPQAVGGPVIVPVPDPASRFYRVRLRRV
jgi:hypothetical protein